MQTGGIGIQNEFLHVFVSQYLKVSFNSFLKNTSKQLY